MRETGLEARFPDKENVLRNQVALTSRPGQLCLKRIQRPWTEDSLPVYLLYL